MLARVPSLVAVALRPDSRTPPSRAGLCQAVAYSLSPAVAWGDVVFIYPLGTLSVFAPDLPCRNVFITADSSVNPLPLPSHSSPALLSCFLYTKPGFPSWGLCGGAGDWF